MRSVAISNNKIKEIVKLHQKKYRDEFNLFIAEGTKAVEELINTNIEIKEIYTTKQTQLVCQNAEIKIVDETTMKKISTTSSPCEILAIAKKQEINKNILKEARRIALFEKISDPGNLGTIIRSAAAFNLDAIILFDDCVELYSPKVIRSSTGNFFKTPIIHLSEIEDIKNSFPAHKIIATSLSNENNIKMSDIKEKIIIMFGSEAKGLSHNLTQIADKNLKLNMREDVESLNLSVSASIIFYELNKSSD